MSEELRIPISASVRHIHLCREDVEALFGAGHQLAPAKALSQPGQFACEETVSVCGPKGRIERVRVLGPEREETQLEISRTDEFKLGVDAPVRASGKLEGTPGIRLEGPHGAVELEQGVIQAARHIHMTPADAKRLGVEDGQMVMVRVGGERGIIYDDVLVRVKKSYALDMHIDTDEANAANLGSDAWGVLIKGPTEVAPDPND
ncbi:propanediol utilization protein [Syntrophotalea acetylenivorans]|uniref:Phosphate propanoyltransferase n=1 Tax=Syntrophotalea acetylenivorans TaxID=1842532 RepID=A0A1L3GS67_9BACT|nr:phosphate propanoyltransferase [Syntrophotalea acetylenivorans]APG28767.1 propanediol utilization protein [Syntrophotalea acetylenivorans]